MTKTKRAPKFTEEERAVLKRIYRVRAQMQKEMEGMTSEEKVAYIKDVEPFCKNRLRKDAR